MFKCDCGGVLLVVDIEPYPVGLAGQEKLAYERKCTVQCQDCGEVKEGKLYD